MKSCHLASKPPATATTAALTTTEKTFTRRVATPAAAAASSSSKIDRMRSPRELAISQRERAMITASVKNTAGLHSGSRKGYP